MAAEARVAVTPAPLSAHLDAEPRVTVREALASVGMVDRPGGEVILASFTGPDVRHYTLAQIGDHDPRAYESLYVASGLFIPGTVGGTGRTAKNLSRVVCLPFDADLVDIFDGDRKAIKDQLWTADQDELEDLITVQRQYVEETFTACGWPIHRLDYTGYGLCAYVYLNEADQKRVAVARAYHKQMVAKLNETAGFALFDISVSDAGTRVARVPDSLNGKSATPRIVRTLVSWEGQTFPLDTHETDDQPTPTFAPVDVPVDGDGLSAEAVDALVGAIRPSWDEGQRHAMGVAVAGLLAKSGVPESQALVIVERLAAGDKKPHDRFNALRSSYDRARAGQAVAGYTLLEKLMPADGLARATAILDQYLASIAAVPDMSVFTIGGKPINRAKDDANREVSSLVSLFVAPEFPIDVFPAEVRKYVAEGAEAINVPADMIALPLLAVTGGTIGNTVALAIRSSWIERANPWLAEVAPPGSGKSPAMDYALAPVRAIQSVAIEKYRDELDEWQAEVDAAKSNKDNRDPLPEKPHLDHYFTTDVTVEGLVNVLSHNPGVTVMRDELGGLVASFDAYRKGADRQSYLSLWAGTTLKVDRKGAGTTYVPRPCVSVIGGIQPDMLSGLGEKDGKRDGFIERFLIAEPKPKPQKWTDADVDPQLRVAMITLFGKLRVKHRAKTEEEMAADFEQDVLFMTAEAKMVWAEWFNQNAAIIEESQGIAAGFYAKYPGQLARIALILHCLHYPGDATTKVGVDSITGAIRVVEYFRGHLVGILPRFGGTGSTRTAGLEPRVMAILDHHADEWIGRTDIHAGLHNNVPAADLNALLERLAAEGKIENRKVQPAVGRPREETRSLAKKLSNGERPFPLAPQIIPFGIAS